MKSRLKKISNHVDPYINIEVEYRVRNPERSIPEERSDEILLVKKLFACTPFISTNSLIYQFAERIENGDYDYISSIEDAENHWDAWLEALNRFLNEEEVVEANFFNTKTAKLNNLYGDQYSNSLYTNDYLDMNKDLNKDKMKTSPTEKENFISDSYFIAKELINNLPIVPRYDLMAQLAQDIERGDFDDISPISEAKNYWNEWLARARKILQARNIILSEKIDKRLKK